MLALRLAEAGQLPDWVVRAGVRALLRRRLEDWAPEDVHLQAEALRRFERHMSGSPVHVEPAAGAPHPVPAAFLELILGRHLKDSCCRFESGGETLDDAEAAMLALTCQRAEVDDGMRILEAGCGWGSLSLWMAQHFPASRITALGATPAQKAFIDARARERGMGNLEVVTTRPGSFETASRFDRVVSVETFQRMGNWRDLMARVARWLDSGGKLFFQVFCHRSAAYPLHQPGDGGWAPGDYLAGAMMPSVDLALHFQQQMAIERVYKVSGLHYRRTCQAWLANLDRRSGEALEALALGSDPARPRVQLRRWRLFLLTCAELFGLRAGNEWFVAQYRFLRP